MAIPELGWCRARQPSRSSVDAAKFRQQFRRQHVKRLVGYELSRRS